MTLAIALGVTKDTVIIGAITGLAYAVLGAGLVLVYRANRVINFAYGEMGTLGAAILALLTLDHGWNFFLALVLVIVLGGAVGALIELTVIRPLARASRVTVMVATIGVAQVLFVVELFLPSTQHISPYPSPVPRTILIGNLVLSSEHFMVLAFVPAIVVGLAILLNRTPLGIGIRASSESTDLAELRGISARRVSTFVWVLTGCLATLTVVLINPLRGTVVGIVAPALGPGLMVRALAAALVGRLVSLPLTLVGGVAIGIGEAVLFTKFTNPGTVDGVLFLVILVLVLLRARPGEQRESGAWSLSTGERPIPRRLKSIPWVRWMPQLAGVTGLIVLAIVPFVVTSSSTTFLLARLFVFAIVGLSVTILTGWAGLLSLRSVRVRRSWCVHRRRAASRRRAVRRRGGHRDAGRGGRRAGHRFPGVAHQGCVPRHHDARVRRRLRAAGSSRSTF